MCIERAKCLCFQNIPIVIAGNKVDIPSEEQEVFIEDVKDWLEEDLEENK